MTEESVLAVVEDSGTEVWLDNALQGAGRIEKVSRTDLGRVLRLLEATGASVALVEVSDRDTNQAMAAITALSNARPWVTVVALCRLVDQGILLQCMRAGARDCVAVGSDAAELRDRLRRHQLVRPGHWNEELQSQHRNLVLVAGVDCRVDTAFLAQNLSVALSEAKPNARILAIDVVSQNEQIFHFDGQSSFDLSQLLSSPDTLDQTLIDNALEEFRPGLRLLGSGDGAEFLGDRGADLFIALSRLMGMFDLILLNVGSEQQSAWVKSIGVHVKDLLVVTNPEVIQLRSVREHLGGWRPHLPSSCRVHLILDGHEPAQPPSVDEIAESTGLGVTAALPMDWKHRLEAINLGLPMQESAAKSPYSKKIRALANVLVGQEGHSKKRKWP
jgi:pilus assembly protein CpaE